MAIRFIMDLEFSYLESKDGIGEHVEKLLELSKKETIHNKGILRTEIGVTNKPITLPGGGELGLRYFRKEYEIGHRRFPAVNRIYSYPDLNEIGSGKTTETIPEHY